MARGPSKVRNSDISKALRAFKEVGLQVAAVEIEPESGKITVRTTNSETNDAGQAEATAALNKWMTESNEK